MTSTTKSSMTYQQHIDAIALKYGVEVFYCPGCKGRAWPKARRVRLPEIKSAVTYAVALHELGHIIGHQSGLRIDREAQAWRWAEANAIEWTETMMRKAAKCIASYLAACARRKNMRVPPANHDAWKIASRA